MWSWVSKTFCFQMMHSLIFLLIYTILSQNFVIAIHALFRIFQRRCFLSRKYPEQKRPREGTVSQSWTASDVFWCWRIFDQVHFNLLSRVFCAERFQSGVTWIDLISFAKYNQLFQILSQVDQTASISSLEVFSEEKRSKARLNRKVLENLTIFPQIFSPVDQITTGST